MFNSLLTQLCPSPVSNKMYERLTFNSWSPCLLWPSRPLWSGSVGDRIDLLNSITCPVHLPIRVCVLYFSFAYSLSRLYQFFTCLVYIYISIACIGRPLYKYVFNNVFSQCLDVCWHVKHRSVAGLAVTVNGRVWLQMPPNVLWLTHLSCDSWRTLNPLFVLACLSTRLF